MNEIEFGRENIILREEVEVFGERDVEELPVDYADRDQFELEVDTGGYVSLESLIDIQYTEDDAIESLTLRFKELPSVEASVRRNAGSVEGELPPVPNVDVSEIDVGGRQSFYERMRDSPESQPAQIRRLIFEHQELGREEFDRLLDEELGYASDGGGTNMSLVVLESVTEEITRSGRGDDQTITWTA